MVTSLLRNRDFVLLQTGQLLSTAGTQATSIAYPLLVLADTHSPAKAGMVSFARLAPFAVFGLAGLLLDAVSARATMAVFAAFGLVLSLWGTLSPAIRAAPSLDELDALPAR